MKITLDAATIEDLDHIVEIAELVDKIEAETDAFAQMELVAQLAELLSKAGSPTIKAQPTLGEFSDDEAGAIALREKADSYWDENIKGTLVINADLGRAILFNKAGRKKVQRSGRDARKLQMLPVLRELIRTARQFDKRPSYIPGKEPDVRLYHYMIAMTELNGELTPVRFVLREMKDATYHYDHIVPKRIAFSLLGAAKEKGPAEASPNSAANSSGPSGLEEGMGGDHPEITVDDASGTVNGTREVLNLFIGEPDEIEAELGDAIDGDSPEGDDTLSDDPNAPNYRYKDTGVVAGARKDNVTQAFRDAVSRGQLIRYSALDWEEIERNPREAAQLIVKSNLFGKVDWAAVRERGMEPGAGFLIDRVYASIAPQPEDSPERRRSYALGIETLRDRMESCDTPDQVTAVLGEIKDEMLGTMLTALESVEYQEAIAAYNTAIRPWTLYKRERNEKSTNLQLASTMRQQAEKEQKRKPSTPGIAELVNARRRAEESLRDEFVAFGNDHPEMVEVAHKLGDGWTTYEPQFVFDSRAMRDKANAILATAKSRNLQNNPTTKAWLSLGDRFISLLNFRGSNGSSAFFKHVVSAKTGKVKDWDWAEQEGAKAPTSTKREIGFRFKVAERYERKGGRKIVADSTLSLKDAFGLREVQSGNWVLNDPASAAFHVQRAAEGFADLADLLGIPDEQVSMGGRLAMAFGARGKGNAGFGGGAAAHYEPVQRVINLTKMKGGGALAHEWIHFVDNLLSEAVTGSPGKADDFVSMNPELLPDGDLKSAFKALTAVVKEGNFRLPETISYTDRDYKKAVFNVGRDLPSHDQGPRRLIKMAADAEAAVLAIDARYAVYGQRLQQNKSVLKQYREWRKIAVAFHDGNELGGKVMLMVGAPASEYMMEAVRMDRGDIGKYWSDAKEMVARAFQSWCEDAMAAKGVRNDYLSVYADNIHYRNDGVCPFPEGDERKRINAAFDTVMKTIRETNVLGNAIANKALMDSIFGEEVVAESEAA